MGETSAEAYERIASDPGDGVVVAKGSFPSPAAGAYLERVRLRREAEQAAARRTRLHYFGLAGGRR